MSTDNVTPIRLPDPPGRDPAHQWTEGIAARRGRAAPRATGPRGAEHDSGRPEVGCFVQACNADVNRCCRIMRQPIRSVAPVHDPPRVRDRRLQHLQSSSLPAMAACSSNDSGQLLSQMMDHTSMARPVHSSSVSSCSV